MRIGNEDMKKIIKLHKLTGHTLVRCKSVYFEHDKSFTNALAQLRSESSMRPLVYHKPIK